MYISKKELETLSKFHADIIRNVPINSINHGLECEAKAVLLALHKRREETNERQYKLIKEKRKDNPNYARPQKEWRRTCKKNGEN